MSQEVASSNRHVIPIGSKAEPSAVSSTSPLPPTPVLKRRKSFSDRRSVKAQTFERKSVKFWVPVHRVTAVIDIVKKFAPVSRRGIVHSIYFDNDDSSMYHARLIRQEGSQLLRFRWYVY